MVVLSIIKVEYIAATEATKQAVWLKRLLLELKVLNQEVVLYSDSQSVIHLCKNPVFHKRSKHIQVIYHFIRDLIAKNIFKLYKIPTKFNPSDMGQNFYMLVSLEPVKVCFK